MELKSGIISSAQERDKRERNIWICNLEFGTYGSIPGFVSVFRKHPAFISQNIGAASIA